MNKRKNITSNSPKETQLIAKKLLDSGIRVFALSGDLGSGKTTFAQGIGKELGITRRVMSPTFIIVRRYSVSSKRYAYTHFYHIDAYRITSVKDGQNLQLSQILEDFQSVVVVEWAEKIKKIIPEQALWVSFSHNMNPKKRGISF